ncbi:MAG TPA: glycoside hydrolase family 3 C-terminal domain-containing protein [Pyrinomonadaceae bacterium]|nr:glycoside hydrolase family 3 C-terminal domain-containing protein [Pyrinomonadaceae bacterium]
MKNHCRVAACLLLLLICQSLALPQSRAELPPYKNPALPIERRVEDLVSRMTLEEKIAQMMNKAPAVERLGIPAYDWWNEALHGVARAGVATVFPQAVGLAATWNPELIHRVADVISTEARAKYNDFARRGERGRYKGLTFWSPNINIFRDPRWGRGQETYGEDPYLTSRLGVAFVRGLQGDHPRYLKVVATPKHYAVHSGPEPERHSFDAVASERDLRETYLPAFRATVIEGRAEGVMCAYNRTNGEPACANKYLTDVLRREWAFKGHVVSDCGAVEDIYKGHLFVKTEAEASAVAVKAGTDLSCGGEYKSLVKAVRDGLITEAEIDASLKRLLTSRFRLGMFDPPETVPFSRITLAENDSPAHRRLALEAARESIVLLKNANKALPFGKELKTIAVIGPNADAPEVLLGNYNGQPSSSTTPLQGIREKVSPSTKVIYALGSTLTGEEAAGGQGREKLREEAVAAARAADAVVLVLGIAPSLEGEEMKVEVKGFRGGDRTRLELPEAQEDLLKAVQAAGKPVALVLMSGSALAVNWADENVPAILQAWYPGEEGGAAIADVLFGDYNPAGRLPVTFYKSADDLPPFEAYGMQGRTYRYFKGRPLYPFGHGLSYTRFEYGGLKLSARRVKAGAGVRVSVDVRNAGRVAGDEVVQLYVTDAAASAPVPVRSLQGVSRITLRPGERRRVSFTLTPSQMALIDDRGRRVVEPGEFLISVGGKQPGFTGTADASTTGVVTGRFTVTGKTTVVP